MVQKKHNEYSKQFMKKILIFIDSVITNSVASKPEDASSILTSGLLNVRDAIFSDIVRDNHAEQIESIINQNIKKNIEAQATQDPKEDQEDHENLSQEKKSAKDQPE